MKEVRFEKKEKPELWDYSNLVRSLLVPQNPIKGFKPKLWPGASPDCINNFFDTAGQFSSAVQNSDAESTKPSVQSGNPAKGNSGRVNNDTAAGEASVERPQKRQQQRRQRKGHQTNRKRKTKERFDPTEWDDDEDIAAARTTEASNKRAKRQHREIPLSTGNAIRDIIDSAEPAYGEDFLQHVIDCHDRIPNASMLAKLLKLISEGAVEDGTVYPSPSRVDTGYICLNAAARKFGPAAHPKLKSWDELHQLFKRFNHLQYSLPDDEQRQLKSFKIRLSASTHLSTILSRFLSDAVRRETQYLETNACADGQSVSINADSTPILHAFFSNPDGVRESVKSLARQYAMCWSDKAPYLSKDPPALEDSTKNDQEDHNRICVHATELVQHIGMLLAHTCWLASSSTHNAIARVPVEESAQLLSDALSNGLETTSPQDTPDPKQTINERKLQALLYVKCEWLDQTNFRSLVAEYLDVSELAQIVL